MLPSCNDYAVVPMQELDCLLYYCTLYKQCINLINFQRHIKCTLLHQAHTVSFHKINEKCLPIVIISLVYNKSSKMIIG